MHCIDLSPGCGYVSYFHSGYNAPMNTHIQVIVRTHAFISLKYIPRRALLGHLAMLKFFILVTLAKRPSHLIFMLHYWHFRYEYVDFFLN